MMLTEDLEKDINKENKTKQEKELNKTIQDLKMEVKTIKK